MSYFTDIYKGLSTKNKISVLEGEMNLQLAKRKQEEEDSEMLKTTIGNTLESLYDDIKQIASVETAMTFISPMMCVPNMFYRIAENDGVKDIYKYYVCMPKDGTDSKCVLVTDENFDDYMVEW